MRPVNAASYGASFKLSKRLEGRPQRLDLMSANEVTAHKPSIVMPRKRHRVWEGNAG